MGETALEEGAVYQWNVTALGQGYNQYSSTYSFIFSQDIDQLPDGPDWCSSSSCGSQKNIPYSFDDTENAVTIYWEIPSITENGQFIINRCVNSSGTCGQQLTIVDNESCGSDDSYACFMDTSIESGNLYYYNIQSADEEGLPVSNPSATLIIPVE